MAVTFAEAIDEIKLTVKVSDNIPTAQMHCVRLLRIAATQAAVIFFLPSIDRLSASARNVAAVKPLRALHPSRSDHVDRSPDASQHRSIWTIISSIHSDALGAHGWQALSECSSHS